MILQLSNGCMYSNIPKPYWSCIWSRMYKIILFSLLYKIYKCKQPKSKLHYFQRNSYRINQRSDSVNVVEEQSCH